MGTRTTMDITRLKGGGIADNRKNNKEIINFNYMFFLRGNLSER